MNITQIKDMLLVLVPVVSIIITLRYRRKDIYNQLLKEQIAAGYLVMSDMLELNQIFNEGYKRVVGSKIGELYNNGILDEEKLQTYQTLLFIELTPRYTTQVHKILGRGFIFPDRIQKLISGYFERINHLFEKENNEDLGINLMKLYDICADLTDELNHYFKIDRLSKQMNKML